MIKLVKDSITQYFKERYVLVLYSLLGTGIFTKVFYAKAAAISQINNLAYAFVLGLSLCLGGDYLFKDNPLLKKLLPMLVALLFGFGYIIASYWGAFPLFQSHIIACAYLLFLLAPKAVREEEKTGFHWVVYVLVSLGTAISISLVLFGLIAFLVWILKQLFGIQLIEYFKYLGLGFFSTFLVLNIFALFLPKPENVSSLKYTMTRLLEKTVKFFFVPVMIVYVLVLLIYSLKILIKFSLPVGMVSLPIAIAYGMYFILNAYLESQNEENLGLWKHRRWLEISFIPLFVTMGVGIFKRISDYGFTIDRFYLLIGFFIIVVSFLIRLRYKRLELRKLIVATAGLFFITSFGPLNPVKVSVRSQSERFISVLQKYQKSYSKLEDFKLSEWSQKDIDSAASAMHVVFNSDGVEVLKTAGLKKNVFTLVNEGGKLGFDLADLRASLDNLSKRDRHYHSDEKSESTDDRVCKAIKVDYNNRKSIYNTRGYDFLYNEGIFEKGIKTKSIPEMNIYIKIDTRNYVITVFKNKTEKIAIDFGKSVRELVSKTAAGKVDDALELVGEANGVRIKMLVEGAKVDCDRPELDATIFVKQL